MKFSAVILLDGPDIRLYETHQSVCNREPLDRTKDRLQHPAFRRAWQTANRQLSDICDGLGFGATASTASPFGGTTSGFGANTSSGGGLFGSNTATSGTSTGFGGFGSTNTNTGGGLFGGANKPAFGSQQPSTGGSLFGGGSNTFGSSNNQTTSAFGGAPISSALGNVPECQGTGSTPFQAYTEKEGAAPNQTNHYQSITFMQPYKNYSFEVSFNGQSQLRWKC